MRVGLSFLSNTQLIKSEVTLRVGLSFLSNTQLIKSEVTLRVGLSFLSNTQLIKSGPKAILLCTIPALDKDLSAGMTSDRLLCPIWALRFYLECTIFRRRDKQLLFISFKPSCQGDIAPSNISS